MTFFFCLQAVMQKWLPLGETMLQTMAIHIPSPVTAQKYRTEIMYAGPKDDSVFLGEKIDVLCIVI